MKNTLKEILYDIEKEENACIVVLDELTDVHNVGAIIRTAVATGVNAIVVSKHNQAPINDTVMRTSAYTAPMIPIIEMNVNDAIRTLKENGFWVHGLFMQGENSLWKSDLKGKTVIVVGSEGDGISPLTKKLCDFALSIPMTEGVESLNASVSAGVALYERLRQIS